MTMSNSSTRMKIDLFSGESCIFAVISRERDGQVQREEYPLLCSFVGQLQLSRGFVDESTVEKICELSHVTRAYLKACSILTYGECSSDGLCRKLRDRGFDAEISRRACELVLEKGLINESDAAVRIAEGCLSKLWGERRIMSKLREKGFRTDSLDGVREMLAKEDLHERCLIAAKKKLGRAILSGKDYSKAYGVLARLGYSPSQINYALKTLSGGEFDEFADDF